MVPQGFTEGDRIPGAPRLFSDEFYRFYIEYLALIGLATYAGAFATIKRSDIREFIGTCLNESRELYNPALDQLLKEGLYVRPPIISPADSVEFVENRRYLAGFFGPRRTVNAVEIGNLYFNIQRNALGRALMTGFAQVAQSERVRRYMERGKDIATKHVKIFSDLHMQDDLPAPMTHDHYVTDSTTATFSDKLLMFRASTLSAAGIGNYGLALGSSMRRDLGIAFARLQAEVAMYAKDGAEIAIDEGWMEEAPMADNRKELARQH